MRYVETPLANVVIVEPEQIEDERGFFARTWCRREFAQNSLNANLAQISISFNRLKGTLRGMHYQVVPHQEVKLVRCTRGAIHDVTLDLRPDSRTYLRWFTVELSADNRKALYVPEGCAHGFQTLDDDTEVLYQISGYHDAASARGVRWDDPVFGIPWPLPVTSISQRDRDYPDFKS